MASSFIVRFFVIIHRSIVDPQFYRQVVQWPLHRAFAYLILLIFITAIFDGISHCTYMLSKDQGLAVVLPQLFPQAKIADGRLLPQDSIAYTPPSWLVAKMTALLHGVPVRDEKLPESVMVVDTARHSFDSLPSATVLLFSAETLLVRVTPAMTARYPYASFWPDTSQFIFTEDFINEAFHRTRIAIGFVLIAVSAGKTGLNLIIVCLFMAFVASVFRARSRVSYGICLRITCFAVTPMALVRIMVALSGTRVDWPWQLSIVLATIVMARGIHAVFSTPPQAGDGNA